MTVSVDTSAVRQKLARSQQGPSGNRPEARKATSAEATVRQLLERLKPEIAKALPSHMSADRLARIALTEVRRNPELLECDRTSLLGAVLLAAQLGLEPGPLGHSYLIPRWNGKTKRKEVHFMIGYRGYLDLLYRSDRVESVFAQVVYEKDHFPRPRYGLNPSLEHEPYLDGPRGKPVGAYVVVRLKGSNTPFFRFMTVAEIEERRRRSATPDAGPWVTDWEAMALKTVVRDAIRWLPLSIEVQRALAQDEAVKAEIQPDMTEALDADRVIDAEFEVEPSPGTAGSGEPYENHAASEASPSSDRQSEAPDSTSLPF